MLAAVIAGSCLSGVANADDDCPVGLVSGKTLDEEFGPHISQLEPSGDIQCKNAVRKADEMIMRVPGFRFATLVERWSFMRGEFTRIGGWRRTRSGMTGNDARLRECTK